MIILFALLIIVPILGAIIGYCFIAPMMAGMKPFTTPEQYVKEPEKHRLWGK